MKLLQIVECDSGKVLRECYSNIVWKASQGIVYWGRQTCQSQPHGHAKIQISMHYSRATVSHSKTFWSSGCSVE